MAAKDFTTATETDPNGRYVVTASKIAVTDLQSDEDAYVYWDEGVGHFDGDWEWLVDVTVDSYFTNNGRMYVGMANVVDDVVNCSDWQGLGLWERSATHRAVAYERDGGTAYEDYDEVLTDGVKFYFEVERDEAVGTYGTLYVRVYSDSGRSSLVSTASVTLHSSKKDFRYSYGVQSQDISSSNRIFGDIENLDLQEASGAMDGSASLSVASSPTLAGSGTLAGSTAASLSASATPQAAGSLGGATSISFSGTAAAVGSGSLDGVAALTITSTPLLGAAASIAGSTAVTFTELASLGGVGALGGAPAISFSVAGDLKAAGDGAMEGAASLSIVASAVAVGPGELIGAAVLSVSGSADCSGRGALAGSPSISLSGLAGSGASGALAGLSVLSLLPAATAVASGSLSGPTGLTLSASLNFVQPTMAGIASFSLSASLFNPGNAMVGSAAITFWAYANVRRLTPGDAPSGGARRVRDEAIYGSETRDKASR